MGRPFHDVNEAAKKIVPMLRQTCGGDEKALRELVLAIYREVFEMSPNTNVTKVNG